MCYPSADQLEEEVLVLVLEPPREERAVGRCRAVVHAVVTPLADAPDQVADLDVLHAVDELRAVRLAGDLVQVNLDGEQLAGRHAERRIRVMKPERLDPDDCRAGSSLFRSLTNRRIGARDALEVEPHDAWLTVDDRRVRRSPVRVVRERTRLDRDPDEGDGMTLVGVVLLVPRAPDDRVDIRRLADDHTIEGRHAIRIQLNTLLHEPELGVVPAASDRIEGPAGLEIGIELERLLECDPTGHVNTSCTVAENRYYAISYLCALSCKCANL